MNFLTHCSSLITHHFLDPECKKAINLFVDGLCKKSQVSATGHYVLSFVTTSEMEITTIAAERSRPARGVDRERAVANDTAADTVCFAEFVILKLRARWPPGPMQFAHLDRQATAINHGREQFTLSSPLCIIDNF